MNIPLIYGAIVGAVGLVAGIMIARRLRRIKKYERAVRAHLDTRNLTAYNEAVMLDYYNMNMSASDAAREMTAANRGA